MRKLLSNTCPICNVNNFYYILTLKIFKQSIMWYDNKEYKSFLYLFQTGPLVTVQELKLS